MSTRAALVVHGVSVRAFYGSLDSDTLMSARYRRARDASMDAIADEAVSIADDESIPPDSRRIRVDTRKWFLSKLAPKRYGDRLELSGDAANPIAITISPGDDKL